MLILDDLLSLNFECPVPICLLQLPMTMIMYFLRMVLWLISKDS